LNEVIYYFLRIKNKRISHWLVVPIEVKKENCSTIALYSFSVNRFFLVQINASWETFFVFFIFLNFVEKGHYNYKKAFV